MMEQIIEVNNLVKSFGGSTRGRSSPNGKKENRYASQHQW